MKKIFSFLFLTFLALGLVACTKKGNENGGGNTGTTEKTCAEDPTQPKCQAQGNTCSEDPYADGCKIDLNKAEFVVVSNSPTTGDPRLNTYEGLNKEQKVAAIQRAEEKYNIKVVYKGYVGASWGESRDNYIITQASEPKPYGHVYEISSSSIPVLAKSQAIINLDTYVDTLGSPLFGDYAKEYMTVFGSVYGYTANIPINDNVLIYNNDLLKDLGYDDEYPSKLWNNGEWTWAKFQELVTALDGQMTQNDTESGTKGTYVMGGRPSNWAANFVATNGGVIVDSNLKVQMESTAVMDTIKYLNSLYNIGGGPHLVYENDVQVAVNDGTTWAMDSDYSDTLQTQFKEGRVVFQDGQTWIIGNSNKLGNIVLGEEKLFEVGVVPYPIPESSYVAGGVCKDGTTTCNDADKVYFNDNYSNITSWGAATYVVSAGWSKAADPTFQKGYDFDDELVFRIWNDIQFGGLDEAYSSYEAYEEAYLEEYVINKYSKMYPAGGQSIDAHEDIVFKVKIDMLFAGGGEANSLAVESTVSQIERAVVGAPDNVEAVITSSANALKGLMITKFEVEQEGYQPPVDPEDPENPEEQPA